MKTAFTFSLLLGLAAAAAVHIGCGAAPASQTSEDASVPRVEKIEGTAQPMVRTEAMDGPQQEVVEVGYKKGMHVPEFGMSLLDGTRVTSAKIVEEGKPTFVYFHATW